MLLSQDICGFESRFLFPVNSLSVLFNDAVNY